MNRLRIVLLYAAVIATAPRSTWRGFEDDVASRIDGALASTTEAADVVFDADGTLWAGDVGEEFFLWQLHNNKFLPNQRESAKRSWEAYQAKRLSEREMWIAAATLQAGLREGDVNEWARQFFRQRFRKRVFPAMRSAVAEFQKRGMRVWIVSASQRWIVEAGADDLKIPKQRVIAVSAKVQNGIITDQIIEPVPFQSGKVDAISVRIGKRPLIAFGDSMNDVPMLDTAGGVSIAINPKTEFRTIASMRGWAIQVFR